MDALAELHKLALSPRPVGWELWILGSLHDDGMRGSSKRLKWEQAGKFWVITGRVFLPKAIGSTWIRL